jgi:hypothetical protein
MNRFDFDRDSDAPGAFYPHKPGTGCTRSMSGLNEFTLKQLATILLILLGSGFLLSLILAGWVLSRIRKIRLPADTDFMGALRATPLAVVVLLDLLDFTLDIFSAPLTWALLSRLGLAPLRTVTVVEALIPGTQLIPTMTAAWLLAKLINKAERT